MMNVEEEREREIERDRMGEMALERTVRRSG